MIVDKFTQFRYEKTIPDIDVWCQSYRRHRVNRENEKKKKMYIF